MAYYLGIDIGTTYTAAAVWRDGRYEIASLGNRAPTIPSVVLLRDDEAVLTGEAAVRRAATEPSRVAREFKRRIGDPTPIIVGGTPYSADALVAKLLRWVVDQVGEVEGSPPAGIAVSHPANWGAYKLDLLRQAIRLADLDDVATLTEPEAAAIHYASQERVEPGSVVAVYDLGGGTFDAAVLRKTEAGWDILGSPEGIERLGGVDFDAAVYHHVVQAIGGVVDDLDPLDPTAQAAVARLRQECVDAKEALSSDSDVSIPVLLPNLQTEVRLTRGEYEQMIRPALADTITAVNRALRSAGVTTDEVTSVLLVGGSSRTPLVAELVSSALGRPVAVDAHPKHGVALGAAITAAQAADGATGAGATGATAVPVVGAAAIAVASHQAADPPETARGETAVPTSAAAVVGPTATPAVDAPATIASDAVDDGPPVTARHRAGEPQPTGRDPRSVTVPYSAGQGPPSGTGTRPSQRGHGTASGGGRTGAAGTGAVGDSAGGRPTGGGASGRGGGGTSGSGSGGGPGRTNGAVATPSRRPLALVGGAVLAVAVAGGAYLALSGDDDDPNVAADSGTPTTESPPSTAPTTTPTTLPPGPFVQIDEVLVEGEQYRVNYEVIGYEPRLDGGPDSLHVHLFLNTTAPENAGTNGTPVGSWDVTDEPQSRLTPFGPADSGGATQMCSAVATVDHEVHLRGTATGNCVDLPS